MSDYDTSGDFSFISPTALKPMFLRSLSEDIPYAKEFWEIYKKLSGMCDQDFTVGDTSLFYERYMLTEYLIGMLGEYAQFLDLASGFSSRGYATARENSDATYIEMDMPWVTNSKKKIFRANGGQPSNLHMISGDATQRRPFEKAMSYFDPAKPVFVITEGLLGYLSMDEKARFVDNIRPFLQLGDGGTWITSDLKTYDELTHGCDDITELSDAEKIALRMEFNERFNNVSNQFTDRMEIERFLHEHSLTEYGAFDAAMLEPTADPYRRELLKSIVSTVVKEEK